MRAIVDPTNALSRGIASIRQQFKVPSAFPAEVQANASATAHRKPTSHVDRTSARFVTLDPASSTDLDQAFAIERSANDLLLQYAIADVGWFVDAGGPMDREAWTRGTTLYLPDGKAPLYPTALSEGSASLLPGVDRPAVIFAVKIGPDGDVGLQGAERAIIRSQAKLAYDHAAPSELPAEFDELARRIEAAETRRGTARIDPPEQEVVSLGDGRFGLSFRPMGDAERRNAVLSLATNLAIADVLFEHKTGLFRTMGEPDKRSRKRLRHTAKALGLEWPALVDLEQFARTLDPNDPKQAAFMLAIRRAGPPASYAPYQEGVRPWHAAVMASYAHATAPLRRLADRYVVETVLAVANGKPTPSDAANAFRELPRVMSVADAKAGQVERAVIDLAETVELQGKEGRVFRAVVTDVDERGARMQLCDLPVVTRIDANGAGPGDEINVQLTEADVERRVVRFQRIPAA